MGEAKLSYSHNDYVKSARKFAFDERWKRVTAQRVVFDKRRVHKPKPKILAVLIRVILNSARRV